MDLWGIDLREGSAVPARVLRHAGDGGAPRQLYDLGAEEFEWYQGSQNTRVFGDAELLISFIGVRENNEADFVGVYRIESISEKQLEFPLASRAPITLREKCSTKYHYRFTRETQFDQFKEKIRIAWDSRADLWVQSFPKANKRIVGVKSSSGEWLSPKDKNSLVEFGVSFPEDDRSHTSDLYPEGQRKLRSHINIERNRKLVADSKARFKKDHGRLFCEACGFDFLARYGREYIECHHTIPVHKLPSDGFTSINDVVLLCFLPSLPVSSS